MEITNDKDRLQEGIEKKQREIEQMRRKIDKWELLVEFICEQPISEDFWKKTRCYQPFVFKENIPITYIERKEYIERLMY